MSKIQSHGAAVQCTLKELRDLQNYVRTIEKELHQTKLRLAHIRAARSLRLARAIGKLRSNTWTAVIEIGRALRVDRPPATTTVKHRSFEVFRRGSAATSTPEASQATVLAEIAARCGLPAIVTLRGCGPSALPAMSAERRCDVGPEDFELKLSGLLHPWLLVDLREVNPGSPWAGVLGVDDMRLNLAMANLIELVQSMQGRIAFARMDPSLSPPLLADFLVGATQVDHFGAFDPDTLVFE